MLVRVAAGVLASQNGSFLKAALVQNRHFGPLVRVRALAGQKWYFFKGRACTESSFLAFGAGPGSGGSKRFILKRPGLYRILIFGVWCGSGLWRVKKGIFSKAGLVENRHFWVLARVRALAGQNVSFLKAGLIQNRHFWALVRVRALGRSKTAHFKRPG